MIRQRPFYFLRHGETDWNLDHRVQGQTDVCLNETGILQAHEAQGRLVDCAISVICCSPLQRAYDTALIVNQTLDRPLVVVEDLREANWGVREGQTRGQWFTDWLKGTTPDGAENYQDFLERAQRGINSALDYADNVLIVAHGGVYRAVEAYARITREREVPNCVPILHRPPSEIQPWWTAQVVGP